ncbi:MAG: hypothetical protein WCD04_03185 [Terriglobia bacterium]|jgi:hypothetical protein
MSAKEAIGLGFKVIVVAIGLSIIFIIGAMVSGIGRQAPTPAGAAAAATAGAHPANPLLLLFIASLIQAIVATYIVLEANWSGWKLAGALFLVSLNASVQAAIEAWYLRGHLSPHFIPQMLIMGVVTSALFAPLAVWILGGFRRGPREVPVEHAHWSAARWAGTLAATTAAFIVLYYLCGYYIAWQSAALRQFYSGTTEIRSFWGQIAWTWSSTPWMFPLQAGRALLFVAMMLPAIRMLRGGAQRVAMGTALMYAVFDGSPGLIIPNPIMPPPVAHAHLVELAVWGLLFGAFVGWSMSQGRAAVPAELQVAKAA